MSNTILNKLISLLSRNKAVFIIGTGRSGTHWLGFCLSDCQEIRATIEVEPIFGLSTQIALQPHLEDELYDDLIKEYKIQIKKSYPKLYLDKSHPNIWIAEKLKKSFPNSVFIGMERNPYATVASMIKHEGVSDWHKKWKEFPVPNRFLGISEELATHYDEISLVAQCSHRWVSHNNKMQELRVTLGNSLKVIRYEEFAYNTEQILSEIQGFLDLNDPIHLPRVKTDSLKKWQKQLSSIELKQIEEVVGISPHDVNN